MDQKSMPLTYEDRKIIDDTRFSVVRERTTEWTLMIREVTWDDRGEYRCTINTNPVRSKLVVLHVKVPATIIDELSSDDVIVKEGDTVMLVCNVTGIPKPTVTWYRQPVNSKGIMPKESK
ncbi:hypothetical protein LSAT2_013939 [Lamellibrachia satsuma]|nr:hypothetical protein LSAT2_013939 [Lamellibrachia satsuma]